VVNCTVKKLQVCAWAKKLLLLLLTKRDYGFLHIVNYKSINKADECNYLLIGDDINM